MRNSLDEVTQEIEFLKTINFEKWLPLYGIILIDVLFYIMTFW